MDDIEKDKNGKLWIVKSRHKTDIDFIIPVLPETKALIEKYDDHPLRQKKGIVLPVLSNQKYNAYLKEIADLAGINKYLTTHLARHTFATTVTLNNGIPLEIVSKMLGHSSVKTTQIYAKVQQKAIEKSMGEMMKKKSRKQKTKKNKKNGKGDRK
jgi:site-specific recombinase XerD